MLYPNFVTWADWFADMVLEDVTEMYVDIAKTGSALLFATDKVFSDPAEGNVKLPKILLNGNNICMVLMTSTLQATLLTKMQMVPGGDGQTVLEDE
jgi:small nuclear ribonucleoprotein (snRNP)-like protein